MRADRLLAVMLLLQTRGKMTTQALAEELGVSRRTILRDVEALSFAGIPIYSEGGHGGGIALDEHYRTTLTGLNTLEVQSLFVTNNQTALRAVGLGDAAERLLLKLLAALPQVHHSTADHIRQRLMIDPTWWWHDATIPPFWDDLQRAVYDDRLIEASYENFDGEIVERVLAPYSLICKSSLWYVLAERDGEFRIYRADRFHTLKVRDQSFVRRPDFDLPTYWQTRLQSFVHTFSDYHCTLRIHPERLTFIRWLMPGRWELLPEPDDRGWLTVRLMMDSDGLARMLIFGLAGSVEIIEPPELAEAVSAQARTLLEDLASPGRGSSG